MANITLGTLRDYWKRVYDAITGPPGSAAPTYAMQVGGTDGTNLRTLKTDASGNLSVLLNGRNAADLATRGYESVGLQVITTLAADTTTTILDVVGQEVHLEALAFACNDAGSVAIAFYPKTKDGTDGSATLKIPLGNGSTVQVITPYNLQTEWNGENDFFKVFKYDDTNKKFCMGMKRQAVFANGLRIALTNYHSATAFDVAVSGLISKWRA